ncbi:rhodanese-like domain-containing protein [Kangiella sp. HZ709]|uniref:rhodanese-like domain-containing protein n=1 Tax=Kangiella sp. HZ709 TaxID=2666328 RepID=UPI0012B12BE1|nr:rhodanese-like domain-containing protein [Kangiella sp. HZ709]MRX28234.1 rhodanese-like domain-containing protein [Kangiella sp. HZ709]
MEQLIEFYSNHYLLGSAWILAAVLLILSYVQTAMSGSQSLTTVGATEVVNRENGVMIDLRSIADFNKGHISGSINLPFTKLKDSMKDLEKYQDSPMIMVCNTGMQAGAASTMLRAKGFKDVHKLKGGIQSWTAENLPLKKG